MKLLRLLFIPALFLGSVLVSGCGTASYQLSVTEELERKAQVEALYLRARKLFARGDSSSLDSAEAAIELSRELVGDQARLLDALGCIEWARGREKLAEFYFKKAVGVDSQFSEAYEHLAFVAMERGESKVAEALLQIALNLKPTNFRARNNQAILLIEDSIHKGGSSAASRDQLLRALHSGVSERAILENSGEEGNPVISNIKKLSDSRR